MTFAATPSDCNGNRSHRSRSNIRTGNRTDTPQGSRFRNQRSYDDPRGKYWKNNHCVSKHED